MEAGADFSAAAAVAAVVGVAVVAVGVGVVATASVVWEAGAGEVPGDAAAVALAAARAAEDFFADLMGGCNVDSPEEASEEGLGSFWMRKLLAVVEVADAGDVGAGADGVMEATVGALAVAPGVVAVVVVAVDGAVVVVVVVVLGVLVGVVVLGVAAALDAGEALVGA